MSPIPAVTVQVLFLLTVRAVDGNCADLCQEVTQSFLITAFWFIPIISMLFAITVFLHRKLSITEHRISDMHNAMNDREYNILALMHYIFLLWESTKEKVSLQEALDIITELCVGRFNCGRASLMIYDAESDELLLCSVRGFGYEDDIYTKCKMGRGVAGWAAKHRQSLILGDKNAEMKYPGVPLENPSIKSSMIVPMILDNLLIGVLNISSFSDSVIYAPCNLQELSLIGRVISLFIFNSRETGNIDPSDKNLSMKNGNDIGVTGERIIELEISGHQS